MKNIKSFESFVNEEVTDSYLRDKIAKAKEGGRQISSGYEEELHKRRNILDTANNRRESEKQRIEQEKKWREFQVNVEAIQTALNGKIFNVDGLPMKVIQVRSLVGPRMEIHLKPNETDRFDRIVVSYYSNDDMKAHIYDNNNSYNDFPMSRLSELFGTLTQIFKKYFPESKFADRKIYSALENMNTDEDSEVNELFGMKRDMKTKKNLENIKEISDKEKENTPEGKAAKYKKMRDDMIADLEKSLEDDED